ncbi:MAG: dihydrofolate reductase [Prevotella sp.]|nr:dihydrofolate reductase [Prevotella sp.]
MNPSSFCYRAGERFADIEMLRYRLDGFENLTLRQKLLVYCLSEATLWGRDVTFDQFGKYNLKIRKTLEALYIYIKDTRARDEYEALTTYLKRVWFSNGIHHHYGSEKFSPDFSDAFLRKCLHEIPADRLPLSPGQTVDDLCEEIFPAIFNPKVMAKRVNKADGDDIVATSAVNFYDGVSQAEAEAFYAEMKRLATDDPEPVSYGLNSTLVKRGGKIWEDVWRVGGRYGKALQQIVGWLEKAVGYADNGQQADYIRTLIDYYKTGDLRLFNRYCIEWVGEKQSRIDFVNGFIEVYEDPLGMKGSWEGIVEYKDLEATRRTQLISENAQWFEDHSPVDSRFKKPVVKGVTANVVCAAMLGGDEYPSTAIGINLPNADWIRAEHGSKSVTIGNLTDAYNKAARGNGFREEFVVDEATIRLINQYGDLCDDLHTDLHECLGHGSGQLLPGVDPDALKAYGNTIEEARADLFGLYYIADEKLVQLGLTPDGEAYKSQYYTYMMNGLLTQLTRIKPGHQIEEAHMRNRSLIAHWCLERGREDNVMQLVERQGKTFLLINDYQQLRQLIAELLAEVQRIKSEGDYEAARQLVERYAIRVDQRLHQEILQRYERLDLAPYKGFVNPRLSLVRNTDGQIVDVDVDYTETYVEQMLRYSRDYAAL